MRTRLVRPQQLDLLGPEPLHLLLEARDAVPSGAQLQVCFPQVAFGRESRRGRQMGVHFESVASAQSFRGMLGETGGEESVRAAPSSALTRARSSLHSLSAASTTWKRKKHALIGPTLGLGR